MSWLNTPWLGYASNFEDALKIVEETGVFYLTISIAYLVSFFSIAGYSTTTRKTIKYHIFFITLWGICGLTTIFLPYNAGGLANLLIMIGSVFVLFQLYYTSILTARAHTIPSKQVENKRQMYAETLLKKTTYKLDDFVRVALINEQILWMIILYRSIITMRAALSL